MASPRGNDPDVSFVIPCFQSLRTLGFTLRSIERQRSDLETEIVLVDSSSHVVADWIRIEFPAVRMITCGERQLPGAARNRGVREARAPLIAFLDADVVAASDWLSALYQKLCADSRIQMIGAAIENGNPISSASRCLYWIEFSEFLPRLGSGFRNRLSSSNLLLRREAFEAAGGFDETLAMSEDLQLCLHFPGGLFFESSTQVTHHHRTKWGEVLSHLQALGYWSGKFRARAAVKGSWLKRFPVASLALPAYRFFAIARRVFRSRPSEGFQLLLHAPLVLFGLCAWSRGFYRGVRDN